MAQAIVAGRGEDGGRKRLALPDRRGYPCVNRTTQGS